MPTMVDLTDALFRQLKAFEKENMTEEEIKSEVLKTKAVVDVANVLVDVAKLSLEAQKEQSMSGEKVMLLGTK